MKKKAHMKGIEISYTHVKIDDKIPIHSLGLVNMLRAIFLKMNEDEDNERRNVSILTTHKNTLKANLVTFLNKALLPVREGRNKDVLVRVPSKFNPVLEETVLDKKYTRFYDVKISSQRKKFNGVKFKYRILFKRKEE